MVATCSNIQTIAEYSFLIHHWKFKDGGVCMRSCSLAKVFDKSKSQIFVDFVYVAFTEIGFVCPYPARMTGMVLLCVKCVLFITSLLLQNRWVSSSVITSGGCLGKKAIILICKSIERNERREEKGIDYWRRYCLCHHPTVHWKLIKCDLLKIYSYKWNNIACDKHFIKEYVIFSAIWWSIRMLWLL